MAKNPKESAAVIKNWLRETHLGKPGISQIQPSSAPDYDPDIPYKPTSMKNAFLSGDEQKRQTIIQRALMGCTEAQVIITDLAAGNNGDAMVAILRANLLEDAPEILTRTNEQLIRQTARYLSAEYPDGGPVTDFIAGMIHHRGVDFAGFLISALIRSYGASIVYCHGPDMPPVVLTNKRKMEYEFSRMDKGDSLAEQAPSENNSIPATQGENTVNKTTEEDPLPFTDLSRVIAMFFTHQPVLARRWFGSVFDSVSQKISVFFEDWLNDPIIGYALCLQAQYENLSERTKVFHIVEQAVIAGHLDSPKFDHSTLPGFTEEILPLLADRSEKVRVFLDRLRGRSESTDRGHYQGDQDSNRENLET